MAPSIRHLAPRALPLALAPLLALGCMNVPREVDTNPADVAGRVEGFDQRIQENNAR